MSSEQVLTHARIVTADSVIADGTVVVRDGLIHEVGPGRSRAVGAHDLAGDLLLPGFVELHTDNLERQFNPRPAVRWPADAAMLQHDAQVAAAGITTVCDAVCCGFYGGKEERLGFLKLSLDVLHRAGAAGALRCDHLLHLRLELADPGCVALFEPLVDEPTLAVVSLMDHTPGQRQWHDLGKFRTFHMGRTVKSETEFQDMIVRRQAEQQEHVSVNLARIVELLEGHPAVRASHDDTTPEHVAEAAAIGVTVSEFPTTELAAAAAHDAGMAIVMGAPNLVLGGSHSGNVGAATLATAGLLDALSSDYVPASLVQGVFRLVEEQGVALPAAVAMISANPARILGLADRGAIAPSLRADLVRVTDLAGTPNVSAVWRGGARIA